MHFPTIYPSEHTTNFASTIVEPPVSSILPNFPFKSPLSPSPRDDEVRLSNVHPFGNSFRFGDNGDGLWAIPGSDIFGVECKSRISGLREVAVGTDSRLINPKAVASGADP